MTSCSLLTVFCFFLETKCDIMYIAFNNISTINPITSTNYKLMVSPSVAKYERNPFFGQNDSNILSYVNVIYNPNSGNKTYEMFYDQVESPYQTLKYAQSEDGLNWIFPNINSKYNNNIILENAYGNGIWKDKYTNDPKQLYKAFGVFSNPADISKHIYGTATSPDGINWYNFRNLSINNRWDTQSNMFYDTKSETYIGITRGIEFPPRTIARTQSNNSNFNSSFSDVEIVETGLGNGSINQTYTQITFKYYNIYLGILMIYDTINQNVYCELDWSQDTYKWYRVGIGQQLIPLSTIKSEYDYGMIFIAAYPIYIKNENRIRLYYTSGDGPHSYGPRNDSVALAFIRKDGYAGITNDNKQKIGLLQSYNMVIVDKYFIVNVDMLNHNDGSYMKVGFKNISGYQINDCKVINSNVTDFTVSWNDNQDLSKLIGVNITIQFELFDAVLYTFGFVSD
eukprot:68365_1